MKNKQRKLSLALTLAIGFSAFTPASAMASTENVIAIPISSPINITSNKLEAQSSFTGAFATVLKVEDNQIVVTIKHSSTEQTQTCILNLSKQTYFIDNQTGASSSIKDIQKDDKIYVYHSMASTRSLPAQTAAFVILTNVKENESVARLIDVDRVSEIENAVSALSKDGEYIINFTKDTTVLPYLTKNMIHYSDIEKDDRVLVWFDIVAPSMPAKATALKAIVLPSVEKAIDENTVKNITFAEFIRHIIIEIDGEKPVIMDTHYARPYMMKAKELGFINEEQYNDQELWNKNVNAQEMESVFSVIKNGDFEFDFKKINSLIINKIVINDIPLLDAETVIRNGVVMVPLRAVSEALGFTVTWDGTTNSVEISNNEIKSIIQLGYNHYFKESINSIGLTAPQKLGAAPLFVDGTTYVPVELFNLLFSNPESVITSDNVLSISK